VLSAVRGQSVSEICEGDTEHTIFTNSLVPRRLDSFPDLYDRLVRFFSACVAPLCVASCESEAVYAVRTIRFV
jgi:nitrate reductase beta subunit